MSYRHCCNNPNGVVTTLLRLTTADSPTSSPHSIVEVTMKSKLITFMSLYIDHFYMSLYIDHFYIFIYLELFFHVLFNQIFHSSIATSLFFSNDAFAGTRTGPPHMRSQQKQMTKILSVPTGLN